MTKRRKNSFIKPDFFSAMQTPFQVRVLYRMYCQSALDSTPTKEVPIFWIRNFKGSDVVHLFIQEHINPLRVHILEMLKLEDLKKNSAIIIACTVSQTFPVEIQALVDKLRGIKGKAKIVTNF